MATPKLSAIDKKLADLYLGGPDDVRGKASACYQRLHPTAKPTTAESRGPAIVRKEQVQAYIQQKERMIAEKLEINAEYVLQQSVELLDMCMGRKPTPGKIVVDVPQPDGGTEKMEIEAEQYQVNPQGAKGALELIGKNKGVQAFQENINWKGKLDLGTLLGQAQKRLESRAKVINGKAKEEK